jgi:iron(III) transport system ATP-binding protein
MSLRIDGAVLSYGSGALAQPVLRGASLSVSDRSTVCLLGPSGSGKTTLLRCIAGLERLAFGRVTLSHDGAERVLDDPAAGSSAFVPPDRRGIGMVFQDWALFPHLDVRANVGYGLGRRERRSRTAGRTRVDELLDLVGLADVAGRMPAASSSESPWRVRWLRGRRWCCSTSRSRTSTWPCERNSARRCATCCVASR